MNDRFDFSSTPLPPGLSVIEASAGTGKTFAISHLVPRLLLEGTVASRSEIAIVTFTNDAARELSDRVRRVLTGFASEEESTDPGLTLLRKEFPGDDARRQIARSLLEIDRLGISTIHSFCQQVLQREGTLCGLPAMPELVTDARDVISEFLLDHWQEKMGNDPLLAAVATEGKWSAADDMAFVAKALAMENFECVPEPEDAARVLDQLCEALARLTPDVVKEFADVLSRVTEWKKDAVDEDFRSRQLATLACGGEYSDTGFREAIRWTARIGSVIGSRSKNSKALLALATSQAAVTICGEVLQLVDALQWAWQNSCAKAASPRVRSALAANRLITQDGIITTLRDALRSTKAGELAARLRERYRVALIDESQDTDARQYEIFRRVFVGFPEDPPLESHRLVMIGDPKQAIYAFRGADVNTYLHAKSEAREIFTLNETFRSPAPLVRSVNAFFKPPGSLLNNRITFAPATSGLSADSQLSVAGTPDPARVEAWIVPDDSADGYETGPERVKTITETVASEITRLMASDAAIVTTSADGARTERKAEPGDFAVLTSSNDEAAAMADALRRRGVPAIVATGEDVMASDEASELLAILQALDDPRRSSLRYAALTTRLMGRDVAALRALRADAAAEDEVLQNFLKWQALWRDWGIAAALGAMDAACGISVRLATSAQGERRVTNFRHLTDLLQQAARDHAGLPGHLLRWFSGEIAATGRGTSPDERLLRLESDKDAVQLVTMHRAKGLEYAFVFAPFLWSSREPKGILRLTAPERADRLVSFDRTDDPAIRTALTRAQLEDRLRLAYVAMTRAKVKLWIYAGEIDGPRSHLPASAIDWLLRANPESAPDDAAFLAWRETAGSPGRGTRHADALREFQKQSPGNIRICPPPPVTGDLLPGSGSAGHGPVSVLPLPAVAPTWSVTSFSSLTREKHAHGSADPAALEPAVPAPFIAPNGFFDAPGGAVMGSAIHGWIETWDFREIDRSRLRRHLEKFAIAPALDDAICSMLEALRGTELPGMDADVATACPLPEGSEWHFHLPIATTLGPGKLAKAFADHAPEAYRSYAAQLDDLTAAELHGLLQGFLDRLAKVGPRWGVIDWKTNRLGDTPDAYGPAGLLGCAMRSHYLLQAHLYLVALRRYLRAVDPAAQVTAAWLVFLRAVRTGTSDGVLTIEPHGELIDALDLLFSQP